MTTKPKLSIIMPIYKTQEEFLREAIESVLSQTFADFELIIVNDSPDDEKRLFAIVNCYCDSRIKWLHNAINGGIAIASNLGIDMAQGEYIAMLDHDDICMPERFALQIKYLDSHPEIGFIGGQAEAFYADGTVVQLDYPISNTTRELKQSFFDSVPFLNPSIMFRASVLGQLRYDSKYKVCADYDLFARLVFENGVKANNLAEILIKYRYHDANTSFNQYLLGEQETIQIQDWISNIDNNM